MKLPKISLEHVRKLHDIEADLVTLHLATSYHTELWGAIRAASAALKECGMIAQRDIDQAEVDAYRAARQKAQAPKKKRR